MSEERCDVAVIGAGLVGVSLAYELACLGTSVAVIDAGHPGRATDAGAGILSPVTNMEADETLWLFARQAGAHYPDLLQRMASDGVDVAGTGYGRCGMLSLGLRPNEDEWFAPFAELVLRRASGEITEITPEEASSLFPPLGPVHRVLHAPGSAACRRPWHGCCAERGRSGTRRRVRDRCGARRPGRRRRGDAPGRGRGSGRSP